MDPPWMEKGAGKCKRGADKHYQLMTSEEIIEAIVNCPMFTPSVTGCHLYLWTTNNFLKDALKVMEKIGFRYITNIVWVKDRFGLGQYFRQQHELCLFGVKGKLMTRTKKVSSVVCERKRKHSEKPRRMYELIEKQSHPPRLEMFSRTRREGWDVWGAEVPSMEQRVLGVEPD